MKLSQKPIDHLHKVLIFGPPKSGKTKLAGTLAEKYNLIWFDLENGIRTLTQLPIEWQERIEVISLPDTRSFPVAIETCLKVIRGGKGYVCEKHGKWNCALCAKDNSPVVTLELNALTSEYCVVIDSLTQLTNSAIAHITKNQPEDYKLQYDDWGNLGKLMDIFLSHVQQAPFNIVCISHETEVPMEDDTLKLVATAGTRNFSRNTAKYFDEVIYCEVKNKKHISASSTTYANKILTGSRSGFALESIAGNSSLIPLFTGEIPKTTESANSNTPATKAASDLKSLAAKLSSGAKS